MRRRNGAICFGYYGLMCLGMAVHSSQVIASEEVPEREQLSRQRLEIERRYAQEVEQCYQRFAVNDCKQQAMTRQRESTKKIRMQEQALDAAQRAEKAASHKERLAARQSPQALEDAAQRRAQAVQKQQNAAQKNLEKNQPRAEPAATTHGEGLPRDKSRPTAAQEEANAQDHARKLQDAATHRAAKAQQRLERQKPLAAPLPVPPNLPGGPNP